MIENLTLKGVAEFKQGCTFNAADIDAAIDKLEITLQVSEEELNRRIREGLTTYWLKHIYDLYVVRQGRESASKDHYITTYIKSGFSLSTYKSYESTARVSEAINRGNLRLIINAFCRFSNEFQQRRHSPLDCLLLIIDGRIRASSPLYYETVAKENLAKTHRVVPSEYLLIAIAAISLVFIGLLYKMTHLKMSQTALSSSQLPVANGNLLPQRQLIDELRDIGSVEYVNHPTDQVKPEKLQIKYPTKHPVYRYKSTGSSFEAPFGGHASFKDESVRINWVLVQCQTDCVTEFTQRGGSQQIFGSTQTHAVVAPPKNNWHVPDIPLFPGRNLFIASATYSSGIKRVESLIIEPQ